MSEEKDPDFGAQKAEFEKILELTTEELLKKAFNEKWLIKYVEFWIKVRNARNFERLVTAIEAL